MKTCLNETAGAATTRDGFARTILTGLGKARGKGTPIQVRMLPPLLADLDTWIASEPDPMTRPEAIRRLVEKALNE